MDLKFGHDFSKVRIHADSQAAASADSLIAAAYTVGNDIVFARGEYSPDSAGGKRLLAHELTHVVQQSGSYGRSRADFAETKYSTSLSQPGQAYSANMRVMERLIQRAPKTTLEANTSESERENLQVPVMKQVDALSQSKIEETMKDESGVHVPGVKIITFSPEIDPKIKTGLEALAAEVFGQGSGPGPNSITYIKSDLSKFGGVNRVYRFTLIKPTADSKEKKSQQLIIEQVSTNPPASPDKINVSTEEKRIAKFELQLGNGFKNNDSNKKQLLSALARVKDLILERIRGATFVLDSATSGQHNECGLYNAATHTITIYGFAFSTFLISADVGGSDFFTHTVAHEIGHAIDFESCAQAKRKLTKIERQLKAAMTDAKKVTIDPNAPIIDDDKKKDEKEKKIKAIATELDKARVEVDKLAKQFDVEKPEEGAAGAHSKEFNKARGKAISDYGEAGIGENFAELAAMFILDPDLLRFLGPLAFKYFSEIQVASPLPPTN